MFKTLLTIAALIDLSVNALPQKIILLQGAENTVDSSNLLELTFVGKERAAALPYLLLSDPNFFLSFPKALITVKSEDNKNIFIEFLKPFSELINIDIQSQNSLDDVQSVASYVLTSNEFNNQNILIVWPNENMENLIKNLKVDEPFKKWPKDVYDRVFVITYDKNGNGSLQDLPQKLLINDSSQ